MKNIRVRRKDFHGGGPGLDRCVSGEDPLQPMLGETRNRLRKDGQFRPFLEGERLWF